MKKGLGKGMGALITASATFETEREQNSDSDSVQTGGILQIDINKVEPNPNQPRKTFEQDALEELAASIKEFGIIQPLLVQKEEDIYYIIAGERRWRAAKMAGLTQVPVVLRELSSAENMQVALIENIQREDLNPMEEAAAYRQLLDEFSYTQEALAKKVGKSRSHISNATRLFSLDPRIQAMLAIGEISLGHAKLLLPIDDKEMQYSLAETITENELSVRQTEKLIKSALETKNEPKKKEKPEPTYDYLTKDLQSFLGTKINIKEGKYGGQIQIAYYSEDDLDRIIGLIKKR